jgi:hypothetical protein
LPVRWRLLWAAWLSLLLAVPALGADCFNSNGNLLIADQFNNRVIEADPAGNILWTFGLGPEDFSPKSIIGVNDAQRVGRFTLMAGTGTPPGCTRAVAGIEKLASALQ